MTQASSTCKAKSSWPGGNGRAMPGAAAMLKGRISRSSRTLLLLLLRILGTVCLAPLMVTVCFAAGVSIKQVAVSQADVCGTAAGADSLRFKDLIDLLLPLLAGGLTRATAQLASLPAFAAAALCLFSLVEPSVIAAGKHASLTARVRSTCCAAVVF